MTPNHQDLGRKTRDSFFVHAVNPMRKNLSVATFTEGGEDLSKIKHVNATMILGGLEKNPIINSYANLDWKGYSSLVFNSGVSGAVFLLGFPQDIGSDGYDFVNSNFATKPELMEDIGKWLKIKYPNHLRSSWGDFSQTSFAGKLVEISERRAHKITDTSSTNYINKQGIEEYRFSKKYTSERYGTQRISKIEEPELRHNECHILAGLHHIRNVTITKEDYEDKVRNSGELQNDLVVNSRSVTMLLVQKNLEELNAKRKELSSDAKSKNPKQETTDQLNYLVNLEISKVANVFEKIFLLIEREKYNERNTNLESNEMMGIAFKSKKQKDKNFDSENNENQRRWINSQQSYIVKEIENLEKELNDYEAYFGIKNLVQKSRELAKADFEIESETSKDFSPSKNKFLEEVKKWKEETISSIGEKVKSEIVKNLEQEIKPAVFDKKTASLTEIEIKPEDIALNKEDKTLIIQLLNNNLLEKAEELFPAKESLKASLEEAKKIQPKFLELTLQSIIRNDRLELLNFLLDKGVDVNQANKDGLNSLHIAAYNGKIGIVNALLDKGTYVDEKENKGFTALHIASQNGHVEIVQALLAKGAKIDNKSNDDVTPIHIAAKNGRLNVVEFLLEKGADATQPNKSGLTPLHSAAHNDQIEVAKALVNHKTNRTKEVEVDQQDENGLTALHIAAEKGNLKLVNFLIDKGSDPNKPKKGGFAPLYIASYNNRPEVARVLIEKGADVNGQANKGGFTPLHVAVDNDHQEVVKLLVEKRANVNQTNKDGFTPLHIAAYKGCKEVVILLVEKGANINQINKYGSSPIHTAAAKGNLEIVKILIEKEADLNQANKNNFTPPYYCRT